MKKIEKRTLVVVAAAALVCISMVAIYFANGNKIQDIMKFKKEYETYNGKSVNEKKYVSVDIKSTDQITYVAEKDLLNKLDNETAIFYFGFPTCPWCRNVIEPLLEVSKKNGMTLYYFNPSEMRNGNSDTYKKLVNKLKKYLSKDATGNETLYVPDVYFVKDGNIVGNHLGSLDSQTDPYKKLSEKQHKELLNIYQENIDKMK